MEGTRQVSPRINTSIEVSYKAGSPWLKSTMRNLSSGGMFIQSDAPMPIDANLSIRFYLPRTTDPIAIEGRVVWVKLRSSMFPSGMGILFTDLTKEHLRRIEAFIQSTISLRASVTVFNALRYKDRPRAASPSAFPVQKMAACM